MENLNKTVREDRVKFDEHERESKGVLDDHEHRLTKHTVKIENLERAVFKKEAK